GWSTLTTSGHAPAHHRIVPAVLLTILPLVCIRAAAFGTKAPRLTDAQINGRRSRTFSEVARNHHIARREVELEVAVRRALDVWIVAVSTRRRERRTFEVERVAVEIASERDIERAARLQNHKRIQTNSPRRAEVAGHHEAMTDVARCAAVIDREVVRISRNRSRAVSVAVRFRQNVIRVHRGVAMETAVEVDNELVLVVTTARVVLENVAVRRR